MKNKFISLLERAKSFGTIDETTCMFLVSIIGIGNTIGRVLCGVVSSIPGVDALMLNNIFISISGLLTIFSGLSHSREYQFFYSAAFGLSICKHLSIYLIIKKIYILKTEIIFFNRKIISKIIHLQQTNSYFIPFR